MVNRSCSRTDMNNVNIWLNLKYSIYKLLNACKLYKRFEFWLNMCSLRWWYVLHYYCVLFYAPYKQSKALVIRRYIALVSTVLPIIESFLHVLTAYIHVCGRYILGYFNMITTFWWWFIYIATPRTRCITTYFWRVRRLLIRVGCCAVSWQCVYISGLSM